MNPRTVLQVAGLGALLFLAMIGSLTVISDLAGPELDTRTVYITAVVFAGLMTPVVLHIGKR